MDVDEFNNDEQIEYEEDEDYNGSRKVSQNVPKDKFPPNIQLKPPGTKQKRRSKNDCKGRDYTCGCGKTYLSYPALYTHIRTKHNGKTPDGTNANQAFNKVGGRGRPRKNFLINEDSNKKRSHDDDQFDDLSEIKELYEKDTIEKIRLQKKEDNYLSIYNILSDQLENEVTEYSIDDLFQKGQKYIGSTKVLYNKLQEWKLKIERNEIGKYSPSTYTCDDLFALFILNFKDSFCLIIGQLLVVYIIQLRQYLNKLGWDFISELKDVTDLPTEKVFTEVNGGVLIPDMIADFIDIWLPNSKVNLNKMYIMVFSNHICDWLKKNSITEAVLNLKLE